MESAKKMEKNKFKLELRFKMAMAQQHLTLKVV
jgi:hypothetical protein